MALRSAPEPAAVDAATMRPEPWRVTSRSRETDDTWTLALEPTAGTPARAYRPGQFAMLYAFGVGEAPISVSGDVAAPGRLVHTVRAVGAVTRRVCAARPGDVLGVRGPFGTAWPQAGADDHLVVVAGGIGLAPLRPVVYRALGGPERPGRVTVLYGGRRPEELLFRDELDAWAAAGVDVAITVDRATPAWRGRVGLVTRLIDGIEADPARTLAVVCGPEVMMRFTVSALTDRGVAPERMHVSLERNMQCAVGLCGHCQLGTVLVCRDGPVFAYPDAAPLMAVREL